MFKNPISGVPCGFVLGRETIWVLSPYSYICAYFGDHNENRRFRSWLFFILDSRFDQTGLLNSWLVRIQVLWNLRYFFYMSEDLAGRSPPPPPRYLPSFLLFCDGKSREECLINLPNKDQRERGGIPDIPPAGRQRQRGRQGQQREQTGPAERTDRDRGAHRASRESRQGQQRGCRQGQQRG